MKMKKGLAVALAICVLLALGGCGDDGTGVYVQSVAELNAAGGIAAGDHFPGLVVSENVTEIQRDTDKTIAELLVREGDDVAQGQELFSYDTDELQLTLDKQRLELQQLEAMVENYTQQIATLERERANTSGSDQLQYTVQIQTMQVDLKEAELNIAAKQTEIQKSENILENAVVVSPVAGRVQTINESGTDSYGNPTAYITIQQAGSYRVKGTLGELQMGGIVEGSRIRILSRTDETKAWYGTVTLVDYENATQGNDYSMYYGTSSDAMTASSRYPFYVALDSTEGLMLGQHVYLEVDTGEEETAGLQLGTAFICFEEDGSAYVWAEKSGKLEKREVTLGDYNMMTDCYAVLDGLTENDYIAFPDGELCVAGAKTTREAGAGEDDQATDIVEGEVVQP